MTAHNPPGPLPQAHGSWIPACSPGSVIFKALPVILMLYTVWKSLIPELEGWWQGEGGLDSEILASKELFKARRLLIWPSLLANFHLLVVLRWALGVHQ